MERKYLKLFFKGKMTMYKILFLMISILICQTDKFEEGVAYYNGRA